MTDQTPDITPEQQEPFFPPQYLLVLAVVGFAVALVVLLTQPVFTVVGYGGVAFGVLALLAWVLMAPDQARDVIGGRAARFGGLSVAVTLIVIVALIGTYALVRGLKVSWDLTQRNDFSLTTTARTAIGGLGKDPSLPKIQLIAFYGSGQAGRRDQDTVLFDDYAKTSDSKIGYQFIDPDRSPQIANQYKITSGGQIAVAPLDAQGQPEADKAQLVTSANQDQLTNAILKVSASGDFRAYFITVDGGLTISGNASASSTAQTATMSNLNSTLTTQFGWKTQQVSFLDIEKPDSAIKLNDASADGEVVVIAGGTKPLPDDQLKVLTDYVNNGGNLIIFADNSLNDKGESLATADNLNQFLWDNFGLRYNNDVILDTTQAFQTPLLPVATDFDPSSFITANGKATAQAAMIFGAPHSIEVNPSAPADVTANALVRTSGTSYASTDLQGILAGTIAKTDADPSGPFVVAAQALNNKTGAHVVLFGSVSPVQDEFAAVPGLDNIRIGFNSLVWATKFDDFFASTNIVSDQKPQDAPIFADQQTIRNVNFLTIFVLPFGVLAIGIFVWWNNRERMGATR